MLCFTGEKGEIMKPYKVGNLKIEVIENDSVIELVWLGKSDDREPSNTLTPFFSDLIQELKGQKVVIDFVRLSYMNSSTVRPILQMTQKFNAEGISTTIFYDPSVTFQRTSFSAIEMLTKEMSYIKVEPKL